MPFFTYILYSPEHDTFYVGQTEKIQGRVEKHNRMEVQSTARYAPWKLCLSIEKPSRSEAMILEKKLKNLSKNRLIDFIIKYGGEIPFLEINNN